MVINRESRLGRLYRTTYEAICGVHPRLFPWHFQWLGTVYLSSTLKQRLPHFKGRVLDVGCGNKPYRNLSSQATEYVGIDVSGEGQILLLPRMQHFPSQMASLM